MIAKHLSYLTGSVSREEAEGEVGKACEHPSPGAMRGWDSCDIVYLCTIAQAVNSVLKRLRWENFLSSGPIKPARMKPYLQKPQQKNSH